MGNFNITPEVITSILTALLTISGVVGWVRKRLKQIEQAYPQAPEIAQHLMDKIKVHLESLLPKREPVPVNKSAVPTYSDVITLAQTGLHAFGKKLAELSPTEQAAIVAFVQQNAPGIEPANVIKAIQEAQAIADAAANSALFTQAAALAKTIAESIAPPAAQNSTAAAPEAPADTNTPAQ